MVKITKRCLYGLLFSLLLAGSVNFARASGEDEEEGVEISDAAVKIYDIQTQVFEPQDTLKFPRSSVVVAQDKCFVYLKDGEDFKEIEIQPDEINDDFVVCDDEAVQRGGEFVINGSNYLRIIFLNTHNKDVGHSH